MDYSEYLALTDALLADENRPAPYNKPDYLDYTRLNRSRMKRWDKQLQLSEALITELKNINAPQHWIIISEPWCGDAAHIVPFLVRMAGQSAHVTYDISLRDSPPFLIESYLTNGGRSIPKLIVRDQQEKDLFTWGPRPAPAQELMNKLKTDNADFETIKTTLQHWYNDDKGAFICAELTEQFRQLNTATV